MYLADFKPKRCARNRYRRGAAAAANKARLAAQHACSAVRKLQVIHVDALQLGTERKLRGAGVLNLEVAGKIPEG